MDDDSLPYLIGGGVLLYLFVTGKFNSLLGLGPHDSNQSASGKPPQKPESAEDRNARAISGALCSVAGGYVGGPAGAKAAGGYCASVGAEAWKGAKWAAGNPTKALSGLYDPLGLFGGKQATGEQAEAWRAKARANGANIPSCHDPGVISGGWRGSCPSETPPGPAPAPPAFQGPAFKPAGFR